MPSYPNQHGRRPGRGLRPWLLLPKILCVAIALGAATSATVLWCQRRSAGGLDVIGAMHILLAHVMVPALLGALFFGFLLLLQHPRIFLKQRWLQVKLLLAAAGFPILHLLATHEMDQLRTLLLPVESTPLRPRLLVILLVALWVMVTLIALGRLKPRLGQNWAKDFPGSVPRP